MSLYILDADHNAVPCSDTEKWAAWFGDVSNRRVALDDVPLGDGAWRVSTVFLGVDHSFGEGSPVLFETMVFRYTREHEKDGVWGDEALRFRTWDEALAGHARRVASLRELVAALGRE